MATRNDLLEAFALLEERAPTSCAVPGDAALRGRRPRRRRQWGAVAAVVGAVATIAIAVPLLVTGNGNNHPATSAPPARVTMPNVVGMPAAHAEAMLQRAGLRVTLQSVPSSSEPGTVVAQSPAVGVAVARGSTVTLKVATPSNGAPCAAANLDASIAVTGETAEQPFDVIALRNTGSVECTLSGYPGLTARSESGQVRISVHHGVYERPDPGPHTVKLAPGAATRFAVGTGLAYQGGLHVIVIRELAITVPGDATPIRLALPQGLPATAPAGQPLPVGITAFGTKPR